MKTRLYITDDDNFELMNDDAIGYPLWWVKEANQK